MSICCNCKKESLLCLHVCADCFKKLNGSQDKEITLYKEMLAKANKILRDNGFAEEAMAIDCLIEQEGER